MKQDRQSGGNSTRPDKAAHHCYLLHLNPNIDYLTLHLVKTKIIIIMLIVIIIIILIIVIIIISLETAMVHEGTPRANWRESGKNVNDESCSTRRALLADQLSFETAENPRSSMPNLLIFWTFSKFVTL